VNIKLETAIKVENIKLEPDIVNCARLPCAKTTVCKQQCNKKDPVYFTDLSCEPKSIFNQCGEESLCLANPNDLDDKEAEAQTTKLPKELQETAKPKKLLLHRTGGRAQREMQLMSLSVLKSVNCKLCSATVLHNLKKRWKLDETVRVRYI